MRNQKPADQFRARREERDLEDDHESELWAGGFSAKSMIGSWMGAATITVAVVAVLMSIAFLRENRYAVIAAVVMIALIWLYLLGVLAYRKLGMRYELTTQQLKHREGILFRKVDRIELIDIDDVNYRQGPVQALMGVGHISIRSSDASHPDFTMWGIANVGRIADLINDARRQERRKRGLHIESI